MLRRHALHYIVCVRVEQCASGSATLVSKTNRRLEDSGKNVKVSKPVTHLLLYVFVDLL